MSKIVARTQKVKSGNLIGIGNHNQRKFERHSNEDIDVEKKNLNYDLVQGRTENFKTDIEKFIDENKSTKRATRKDAVLVNEWLISSDQEFFKSLSADKTREFFETSKDYFAEKFGDQNIRYAIVHLDETTPHMHMGIVPFDEDNKLSAKRVFNKTALKTIQAELPEYLKDRGFDIERGEKDSERKNLSVPEYKKMKREQEELEIETEALAETKNALETKIEPLKKEIQELSEKRDGIAEELSTVFIEEPKQVYKSKQSKAHLLVDRQDLRKYQEQNELIPKLVAQNKNLKAENEELEKENIELLEENELQDAQIYQMQQMLEMARERMERFVEKGAKLWDRVITYTSSFYPRAKEITPTEMRNDDIGEQDYQEWRIRAQRHEMER